jgi:hypothetical protein
MMTGIGCSRISLSRKLKPSIFGISMSKVRTSGRNERISSRATRASGAAPTTVRSGVSLMISLNTRRMSAESSTRSTVMGRAVLLLVIA